MPHLQTIYLSEVDTHFEWHQCRFARTRESGMVDFWRTCADMEKLSKRDTRAGGDRLNVIKIWRPGALPGMECLNGRSLTHAFPMHFHNAYCIPLIENGVMGSFYRGAHQRLGEGDCELLSPGEPHSGYPVSDEGWRYRCFYLDEALVETMIEKTSRSVPDGNTRNVRANRYVYESLSRAHLLLETGEEGLEPQTLIALSLSEVFRSPCNQPSRTCRREISKSNRVREFIVDYFAERLSIITLAASVELHPVYLVRVFRKTFGMPPHAFQRQVRLNRAQRLLALGMPIAEAAAVVGFADQSHLSRVFRDSIGITPGAYASGLLRSRH